MTNDETDSPPTDGGHDPTGASPGSAHVKAAEASFDTGRAHPARVYDYWLGGKDNYAADRAAAEAMTAHEPAIPMMARANREFLAHAVAHLVSGLGVRQFLDIGSGIPTAGNVHEVAQYADPTVRVVYVDNDPVVLAHSRALLSSTPQGRTAFVAGDVLDPEAILADPLVFGTLDRDEPVAVMLVSVLMYFTDDQVVRIVSALLDAVPPGSYLTVSHPTADFNRDPTTGRRALAAAAAAGLIYRPRTRAEVAALFDGLDLVAPGVVPMLAWRPPPAPVDERSVFYWVGMGRKT